MKVWNSPPPTTSLREHLETKHVPEWRDMKQKKGEKSKKEKEEKEERAAKKQKFGPGAGQPTIFQAVNKMTKVDPQGAKQQSFDKLFLELLACNFLPFNLADSPEWHSLVQYLDKTINLNTGNTYSCLRIKLLFVIKGRGKRGWRMGSVSKKVPFLVQRAQVHLYPTISVDG